MLNGRPASLALADSTALAQDVLRRYAESAPDYRRYRMADVHADIVRSLAAGIRLAARHLDGGPLPAEDELSGILTLIADTARSGVPIGAMLALADETVTAVRAAVLAPAEVRAGQDLPEIHDRLFAYSQHIHTLIPICYIDAAGAADGGRTAPSPAEELLSGRAPSGDRAHGYLVVRLVVDPWPAADSALPPAPGGTRAGAPGALPPHIAIKAGHDLAEACRQIRSAFPTTHVAPRPHRGLLFTQAPVEALRRALREINSVLETDITAVTAAVASAGRVPGAVDDTRELARIVTRLRYPAGVYTFSDLAVEFQLTRPGPGRDRLAEVFDALEDNAGLIETLGVHIGNDLDRRRTATALGLHPNTVDHRLKRIAKITGHDPTRIRGLRHLHAATVVDRFLQAPMPRAARVERSSGDDLSCR